MTKNRNLAGMLPDGNAMMVPKGNTAQRPANTAGMIRFNTDLNTLEAANGIAWANVGSGSGSSGGGSAPTSVFNSNPNTITSPMTLLQGVNYTSTGPIIHTTGLVTNANSLWKII